MFELEKQTTKILITLRLIQDITIDLVEIEFATNFCKNFFATHESPQTLTY